MAGDRSSRRIGEEPEVQSSRKSARSRHVSEFRKSSYNMHEEHNEHNERKKQDHEKFMKFIDEYSDKKIKELLKQSYDQYKRLDEEHEQKRKEIHDEYSPKFEEVTGKSDEYSSIYKEQYIPKQDAELNRFYGERDRLKENFMNEYTMSESGSPNPENLWTQICSSVHHQRSSRNRSWE